MEVGGKGALVNNIGWRKQATAKRSQCNRRGPGVDK